MSDAPVDLSGLDAFGGFTPLPNGPYHVTVADWQTSEVGPSAAKMTPGTLGTRYELNVEEGEYEGRKLWVNYWHAGDSLKYYKGFLKATGIFSDDELEKVTIESMNDGSLADQIVAAEPHLIATAGKDKNNPDFNQVKGVRPYTESFKARGAGASAGSGGLLP